MMRVVICAGLLMSGACGAKHHEETPRHGACGAVGMVVQSLRNARMFAGRDPREIEWYLAWSRSLIVASADACLPDGDPRPCLTSIASGSDDAAHDVENSFFLEHSCSSGERLPKAELTPVAAVKICTTVHSFLLDAAREPSGGTVREHRLMWTLGNVAGLAGWLCVDAKPGDDCMHRDHGASSAKHLLEMWEGGVPCR